MFEMFGLVSVRRICETSFQGSAAGQDSIEPKEISMQ